MYMFILSIDINLNTNSDIGNRHILFTSFLCLFMNFCHHWKFICLKGNYWNLH